MSIEFVRTVQRGTKAACMDPECVMFQVDLTKYQSGA